MSLNLVKLTTKHEGAYERLLSECPHAMAYHSLTYRKFLRCFLPSNSEDHYLLAFEDEILVGAMPCFLFEGPQGIVINSLPFFGSHGSILTRPEANPDTSRFIAQGFEELCKNRGATFATVIDTPFENNERLFKSTMNFQYTDYRIGLITWLPGGNTCEAVSSALLSLYHPRRRTQVRKALRANLRFGHMQSQKTMDALYEMQKDNISNIGGIHKPKSFFTTISNQMQYDKDYRVYTAQTEGGEIVCALMLLYFKDTVEYFVPATLEGWRNAEPLSALIHTAMIDAVIERQSKMWNWGGTWPTQSGVRQFKSRWGTQEYPYYYHAAVFNNEAILNGTTVESLGAGYPWFYTIPYSVLEK
jgi:hypothetical protein